MSWSFALVTLQISHLHHEVIGVNLTGRLWSAGDWMQGMHRDRDWHDVPDENQVK